eukprot:augustus_masked-scaffold_15-processed-gene-3.32-mRNA-1 protein AED:0.02 eAED:0.04 QI:0/-1/0/1/-1/1/1/0/875
MDFCSLDNLSEPIDDYAFALSDDANRSCFVYKETMSEGVMFIKTDATLYELCLGDYFLPIFPSEVIWDQTGRAIAYLALSLFSFIGVSLVSDKFMSAIEVITAKERNISRFDNDGNKVETTVLIWNDTVANLSLMAFGSSAPEILLSLVESLNSIRLQRKGLLESSLRDTDGLGPSTIVGSAAFNLLVITGVCIFSVPGGKVRKIEKYGVFIITSLFSMAAYIWMYLILVIWTPDLVTMTEALLTLAGFPMLVLISYLQDVGLLCSCFIFNGWSGNQVSPESNQKYGTERTLPTVSGATRLDERKYRSKSLELCRNELIQLMHEQPALDVEDKEKLAEIGAMKIALKSRISRIKYRIQATRWLFGQRQVLVSRKHFEKQVSESSFKKKNILDEPKAKEVVSEPSIGFKTKTYRIGENEGKVSLLVERVAKENLLEKISTISYETSNGRAIAGVDYEYTAGTLTFMPGEQLKFISVNIIDDNEFEEDEEFYLVLKAPLENAVLAPNNVAEITIIDDDNPGKFGFLKETVTSKESSHHVELVVKRFGGVDGTVRVKYRTEDYTAINGKDYHSCSGILTFLHGEAEKTVQVALIDSQSVEKNAVFGFSIEILEYPQCGAQYSEYRLVNVVILSDENFSENINELAMLMKKNLAEMEIEISWKQQIVDAVNVFADREAEEGEDPSLSIAECIVHFISLPFKLLTAVIPPTSYLGGWLTFAVSLLFCGMLTTVVGDMAGIFGCLIGMPKGITAITFVALGTSIPDMFASMFAAENDDNADAAVGNVTGSNSVNVFVGLGLPWTIACAVLGDFHVQAGNLSESVFVFLIVAVVLFLILGIRRYLGLGELGGSRTVRLVSGSACISLWGVYILRSVMIYLTS